MIKKVIATLIILIMSVITFAPIVYATLPNVGTIPTDKQGTESTENMLSSGQATVTDDNGQTTEISIDTSKDTEGMIGTGVIYMLSLIPFAINKLLSIVAVDNGSANIDEETDTSFTIESLLTNEYSMFNIDIFEQQEGGKNTEFMNTLKKQVAIWYTSLRNLAVVGCAIVAIYVGIRMAISSVAEEQAKYKKMLTGWLIGVILLFLMHFLISIMIKLSNSFIEFISKAIESDTNTVGMEKEMVTNVFGEVRRAEGFNKFFFFIMYCVLTYYELKFFIMYLFRVLKIFILTIISPLMCLTYPIDILGNGRAEGFNNWVKKMMVEIFIQPLHLVLYVVFIYSAGEIAKAAPLIGIIFIIALDKAEDIVMNALKLKGDGIKDVKLMSMFGGKGK